MLRDGRILFVGAHPDDIVINAGGTIRKLLDVNTFCRGLTLSRTNNPERFVEESNCMSTLGLDCDIANFPDTKMYKYLDSIVSQIESVIKEHNINTVFTHYPDAHQDHNTVHHATLAAARNCNNIYLYNPGYSGINTTQLSPNVTVVLSKQQLLIKQLALSKHKSQVTKYGEEDWIDRIEDASKHYAWTYGGTHGYAECFIHLRSRIW